MLEFHLERLVQELRVSRNELPSPEVSQALRKRVEGPVGGSPEDVDDFRGRFFTLCDELQTLERLLDDKTAARSNIDVLEAVSNAALSAYAIEVRVLHRVHMHGRGDEVRDFVARVDVVLRPLAVRYLNLVYPDEAVPQ